MNRRAMTLWVMVIVTPLLSGCIHTAVAMSPATRPMEQNGYRVLKPASGTDCLWSLFGVLPVTSGNTLQGATAEAIRNGGGDALIQVTADTFFQHFLIVARHCTQVEGIAVDSRAAAAGAN